MRLFIAAELPEDITEALAETSAMLRGCIRGRYVASDSFHVTLAFLGEVASERIGIIEEAIEVGCAPFAPFHIALGSLGSFGRRSAATLWQGFSEAGKLPELAHAIRDELGKASFHFDDKSFLPHVTLMRKANLSSGVLPMPFISEGEIERVTLFSSDLGGARPVYEAIYTAYLDVNYTDSRACTSRPGAGR